MSLQFPKLSMKLTAIAKLPLVVGVGMTLASSSAFGQENVLRGTTPTYFVNQSTYLVNQSTSEASKPVVSDPIVNPILNIGTDEQSENKRTKETASPKQFKRDPIVLPVLAVPDISIKAVGRNAIPENSVAGRLPGSIPLPFGPDRHGSIDGYYKTWTAPVFCHQPTYFEDTMLEQHGHERFSPFQPLVSGVRFYSTAAFLPYLAYLDPPLRYSHSTDHYRPGSAAPCLRQRPPYDKGAMRMQLLTTGTAFLTFQP